MKKAIIENINTPENNIRKIQKYKIAVSFALPFGIFNEGDELIEEMIINKNLMGYVKLGYIKKNGFIK